MDSLLECLKNSMLNVPRDTNLVGLWSIKDFLEAMITYQPNYHFNMLFILIHLDMYELHWSREQNRVKPKRLLIIFDHVPLTVPTKIYPCELLNIFLLIFTHEKRKSFRIISIIVFSCYSKAVIILKSLKCLHWFKHLNAVT